jgi:hypothetical protein
MWKTRSARERRVSCNSARLRVRSPQLDVLGPALEAAGAVVTLDGNDTLAVRDLREEQIGEIA